MTNVQKETEALSKQSFGTAWRSYRQEMWNQRRWAIPGLLLPGLGNILVAYVPPLIIGELIRDFNGRIPSTWREILPYIILMTVAWIVGEIIWRIAFLCLNRADSKGMTNLYITAMRELLKKDLAFFNDNFAGSLTKKALGYGKGFEPFTDTIAFNILGNLIPLIFAVVILWTLSPYLVLTLIGIITLGLAAILPAIKNRQKLVAERERTSNRMAGHVADVISNISAVQAFARESDEQKRHDGFVHAYMGTALRTWDYHVFKIEMKIAPLSIFSNILGLIIAIMVSDNAVTTAAVFISFNYFVNATRILFEFNRIYRNIENALTEAAEFTALLAEAPALTEKPGAHDLKIERGEVNFRNV